MTSEEIKYHKNKIATQQLKTAVELFLNRKDLSSVITLASAAGSILSQLARNAGEEPFIDYACRIHNHLKKTTPGREKYNHFINITLGIIPHKHMRDSDSENVELDLLRCALNSLIVATSDFVTLYGRDEPFVKAFLLWTWHNTNGKKLMEELKDVPTNLIQKKKKNGKKKSINYLISQQIS